MQNGMRNAYALLGLSFFIVFIGAYMVIERANAPTPEELPSNINNANTMLTLTSPMFRDGGVIPSKYTCDGENVNPELRIEGIPQGTQSLVLVMDDPDIPDSVKERMGIEKFDHWVVYNIPMDTNNIPENTVTGDQGLNSAGNQGYTGPCPPDREHRYIFRLYAISERLDFANAPTLDTVEEMAREKMLDSTTLMGRYERIQ